MELTTIGRTRSVGELRFDGAEAEPLADDGGVATARLRDAGRVILAADSLGAGQAMIEKAVDYAGQREQFGRLIGRFQAVKHMCAERSEKRRVGKECVSTCSSRGAQDHLKKNRRKNKARH